MKKRILSVLLAVCMMLTLVPAALAEDIPTTGLNISSSTVDSQVGSYQAGSGTVTVEYSEETSTVTITMNGASMTGGIYVNDLNTKLILTGENSIDVENDSAISVYSEDNVSLTICGEGSLTATTTKTDDNDNIYTAIYSNGEIIVDESTVQADSNSSNGFYTNSNMQIKNGATVKGECCFPLLFSEGDLQIQNATVDAEVWGGYGIWSNGDLSISANSNVKVNGYTGAIGAAYDLSIADSTVTAYSESGVGVLAYGDLTISGENTVVEVETEAEPQVGLDDEGDEVTYVFPAILIYGDLSITGGRVTAEASDAVGISAYDITISGETTDVTITGSTGVRANGTLNISGGTTTVTAEDGEGIHAIGDMKLTGGKLTVTSKSAGIYVPDGGVTVNGGELNVTSEDIFGILGDHGEFINSAVTITVAEGEEPFSFWCNDGEFTFRDSTLTLPNASNNDSIQIGSDEYYLVTFDAQNGTETQSSLIKKDEKISVDEPNKENYTFDGWFDAPTGGTAWDLDVDTVSAHITLYAQWKQSSSPDRPTLPPIIPGVILGGAASQMQRFVDVTSMDYYFDAVQWAVEHGITEGTGKVTFSPDAPCTRAQAVTFLWRALGCPAAEKATRFTDVKYGSYYANAVAWAVENGVTVGTSATTFSPDAPCTRSQIVTFLYRAIGVKSTVEAGFSDVSATAYYADAINWAAQYGITGGTGANRFSPDMTCTRSQIVTFLYRAK